MRMRPFIVGFSLAAIALGACALNPPPPADATPTCGSTLTASVTFTRGLVCTGNGLVIAAEGITVNLNGHSITGNGSGSGSGIVTNGHAVTIRDGRITNFDSGVSANQGPNHGPTIVRVHFDHNQIGVLLVRVGGALVRASSFMNNRTGISCGEGGGDGYSGNTFSKNTDGVDLFKCNNVRVRNNSFSANTTGISGDQTLSAVVESNHIAGGTTGIDFELRNQDAVITRNTIINGRIGIRVSTGGVSSGQRQPVSGNTISRNVMRNNGAAGLAIIIDATQFLPSFVSNNVVIANVFDRNGFHPAGTTNSPLGTELINDGAYANVLNGDDAFTFRDNVATGNADLGIQAVAGINDGGGNTASGNGNAAQCLGVAC
ncbi:MAG TPA: NosD domain-containing protein [Acidimicrobiia bacterium]